MLGNKTQTPESVFIYSFLFVLREDPFFESTHMQVRFVKLKV